jgi:2-C-methyl-D-erythritol 4-phosphate cytidylyltransferase
MQVTAILLAAGKGVRLKSRVPKPLIKLKGRPVISYSLEVLARHPLVSRIILAVNPGNIKAIQELLNKSACKKPCSLVLGGARRQDSVFNALKEVGAQSRLVLIHDCARPFVKAGEISVLIREAKKSGSAILGVPVKATIKQIKSAKSRGESLSVDKTIDREKLWEVLTPQVFERELIVEAYRRFGKLDVTDDASLIEKLGKRIVMVPGSYNNIKITTPEDIFIAEAILRADLRLPRG